MLYFILCKSCLRTNDIFEKIANGVRAEGLCKLFSALMLVSRILLVHEVKPLYRPDHVWTHHVFWSCISISISFPPRKHYCSAHRESIITSLNSV